MKALKDGYFKDMGDLVNVSDGPDDSIHVVIVSRKFDGRRMKEKNDLIWSVLVKELRPEEWGKVSLSVERKSGRDQSDLGYRISLPWPIKSHSPLSL